MICALCLQDKELCESHIIPEWVFKPLYDGKHRFQVLSTLLNRPSALMQKGIRESLLCDECEQKFSVNEKYARELLLGGTGGTEIVVRDRGKYLELSNLDYKKFKLFQMSVLWRAGVAKHQLFSCVKLGPHEQMLRQMLYEENPGTQEQYCCMLAGLQGEKGVQADFIDNPTRLRIYGRIVYRFIFAGVMWLYFVSSQGVPPIVRQFVVNEVGEMKIWRGRFEDLSYLRGFFAKLYKIGRMPKPT